MIDDKVVEGWIVKQKTTAVTVGAGGDVFTDATFPSLATSGVVYVIIEAKTADGTIIFHPSNEAVPAAPADADSGHTLAKNVQYSYTMEATALKKTKAITGDKYLITLLARI